MSDETTASAAEEQVPAQEAEPKAQEAQTPEAQPPEPQAKPTPQPSVESFLDERIRSIESRLSQQLNDGIERIKTSGREATRERFEQISQRLDELKMERQAEVRDLLKLQQIDPTAAAIRLSEIDGDFQRRKLEEQRQLEKQPPSQPTAQSYAPPDNAEWERFKRDALELSDLTGQEPEFRQAIDEWRDVRDLEGAKAQFKRVVKKARTQVDARVNPPKQQQPAKTAPVIEVGAGGGKPVSGIDIDEAIAELKRLNQKRDLTKEDRKRRDELDKVLS